MVALDKETGKLLWKSESLNDSEGPRATESASYVSPILLKFAGRKLVVGCSLNHLFCVDAATGKLQWTRRVPTRYSVLAMMPVLVGDGIFMTAPHGKGGRLFRLLPPQDGTAPVGVEELWTTQLDTCQGGVVHADGKLMGSFYPGRKGWGVVNAADGKVLYSAPAFTKGAGLWADGRLYALCEDGEMVLFEPSENELHVRGRFKLADASARDAWAHPVIHDGRLYLRYHEKLHCYDVREGR